jgi:phage-related protein
MSTWHVTFCSEQTIAEFLDLPRDVRAKLTRTIGLFEASGPAALMMPLARPVDGKLWELRAAGRDGIARCLYVLDTGRALVILRAFEKKTQKTPRAEIKLAWARWEEYS